MTWGDMKDDDIYKNRDALMARMDSNLQHLVLSCEAHFKEDKENFKWIFRILWAAGGMVAFIAFIVKYL